MTEDVNKDPLVYAKVTASGIGILIFVHGISKK